MKELVIGLLIAILAIWLLFSLPRISQNLQTAAVFNAWPTSTSPSAPASAPSAVSADNSRPAQSRAAASGRFEGAVIFIPACGSCRAQAGAREIQIYDGNGALAATAPVDSRGSFAVNLAAGSYSVNITHLSSAERSNTPFSIIIRAGQTTRTEFAVQL